MFRKTFEPFHLKICNVFGKRNGKCYSQSFLKPLKIVDVYCSTLEVWLNNLFSLGQVVNVPLLSFSKAESQLLPCRTAVSALYLMQNQHLYLKSTC